MRFKVGALLVVTFFVATGAFGQVWYVNENALGAGTGLSWTDAFTRIQPAIDAAFGAGGGQVWVAQGIYNEARTEPWGAPASVTGSLVLKDNVHLYGGFDGTETALSERAPNIAFTVIDGSVSRGGSAAYHVVVVGKASGSVVNVRIDGFTIRGGRAAGINGDYHTWNGAGLYNWQTSDLVVANCRFLDNVAAVSGGAIANEGLGGTGATAVYENCLIYQNTAQRLDNNQISAVNNPIRGGGGVFINLSNPTLVHCTIADNVLGNAGYVAWGTTGGGIYKWAATMTINSSILWNNTGGGLQEQGGGGGSTVQFCNMQAVNPQFRVVPSANEPFDYMLRIGVSPDINTGDPAVPRPFDMSLVPRPIGGTPDKGCFEMSPNGPTAVCQNPSVALDALGNASITVPNVDNGSSAEAVIYRRFLSVTSFTCVDIPSTTTTLTVLDRIGRSAQCVATVTVSDLIAPTVVCVASPFTVNLSSPTLNPAAILDAINSSDNCGTVTATLIDGAPNRTFTCADIPLSPIIVTLTGDDGNGNTNTCQTSINVVDDVDPIPVCQDVTVNLSDGGTVTAADVDNGSSDACSAVTLSLQGGDVAVDCANVGTQVVTLEVEDAAGNTATCTANVTIVDDVDPVAACQNFTLDIDVQPTLTFADIDNGSSDTCGLDLNATTIVPDTFDCTQTGDQVVTLTVFDASGNSDSCAATVTVVSALTNTLQSQASYQLYDGDALPAVMQTEACGGVHVADPYSSAWYFDADGFGVGDPAVQVVDGLGGHPADASVTVAIGVSGGAGAQTTLSFDTVSVAMDGEYRSEVTDSDVVPVTVGSSPVTLNVEPDLAFVTDLATALTANNDSTNYSMGVVVGGGYPPYSYVWFYDDGVNPVVQLADGPHPADAGVTISGATTDTMTFDIVKTTLAGDYSCQVTDSGDPRTITSTTGTLTITTILEITLVDTVRAYTDYAGNIVLTATIINGTPPFTYTWSLDGTPLAVQPGSATLDLGTPDLDEAGGYTLNIVDSTAPTPQDVTSNVADVQIADPVTITVQPADVNVYTGEAAGFSVTVSDGFPPYDYDWQLNSASLGAPSQDSYTLPSPVTLANDGELYDVVVSDQGANQADFNGPYVPMVVTSTAALLSVTDPVVFTVQPQDASAYTDEPPFTLSSYFEGGMEPMTFSWSRENVDTLLDEVVDGPNAITTPNTAALTIDPSVETPGSYDYRVEVTDQVRTTASDDARVVIALPLAVTDNLDDATGVDGNPFEWSFGLEGGMGNVDIAWKKDDGSKVFVELVDDARVSGQGTTTLSFSPVQFGDEGVYRVDITDDGGRSAQAGPATLLVVAGVPAAGALGLALLTALSALGGAAAIRRRK